MDAASWISVHIYYHDGLDGLIDGAARPLVAELRARALIDKHFFVRYWQGGPHLRLRLLPSAGVSEPLVAGALDDTIAGFLRASPSRTVLRHRDYLQMAGPLAAVEPGQAVEPFEPNNAMRR